MARHHLGHRPSRTAGTPLGSAPIPTLLSSASEMMMFCFVGAISPVHGSLLYGFFCTMGISACYLDNRAIRIAKKYKMNAFNGRKRIFEELGSLFQ